MLTPDDLKQANFTKAVFGGYDMQSIDQLFQQIVRDYTELYERHVSTGQSAGSEMAELRNEVKKMRATLEDLAAKIDRL